MIRFLRAGLTTSLQDSGRVGWSHAGVPVSGFMDPYLAGMTNLIAGKKNGEALIELSFLGPKLLFDQPEVFVLGCLGARATLDGMEVPLFTPVKAEKGMILDVEQITKGMFGYLSFFGEITAARILGSKSMFEGITAAAKFTEGDELHIQKQAEKRITSHVKVKIDLKAYKKKYINVFPGPAFYLLTNEWKRKLTNSSFTLTRESDRMAYTFKERFQRHRKNVLTTPVFPGTVQLTPDGKLILLMKDAQVTGGYPHILQVDEEELHILAQKRPGEKIGFTY